MQNYKCLIIFEREDMVEKKGCLFPSSAVLTSPNVCESKLLLKKTTNSNDA